MFMPMFVTHPCVVLGGIVAEVAQPCGGVLLQAFKGCSGLTAVYLNAAVLVIEDQTFEGCLNLERVAFMRPGGYVQSYFGLWILQLRCVHPCKDVRNHVQS
jgi:hypothetical protein